MSGSGARPRKRRDVVFGVVLVLMAVAGIGLMVRSGQVLATSRHLPEQFSVPAPASSPSGRTVAVKPAERIANPASTAARSKPVATAVWPFIPESLRIDGLHVRAPVVGVLSDAGALNPPEEPQTVGWWLGSALAGADSGTTVVVGHIDSATRGRGALFRLDRVRAGDTVRLASGRAAMTYRVVSLHFYVKAAGLPQSLFVRSGSPRLVVVSCGGSFDRATRSYRENVVVVAEPVVR